MFTNILIYLSIGAVLWLLSDKSYLDNDDETDNDVHITCSIISTINLIVLWPVAWTAYLILYLYRSGLT